MPYFSLVDRRRRRHGWDSASMSSSSSSDSDSDDDSGHGQDCLPAPKLPCALRSGWSSHLSDLGTTSGTSSATTSTSTSASSSGLGSSACVKPTNYASSSNGIAEPASIGTKLEVAKTSANIESGSSSKTGFPLIGNNGHDKYARPPNWDALLFGGPERSCQEILTYPEGDTYFEDCKLAGDVALNMVANNIDVPVFNNLRNCNQTQITNALRSLRRSRGANKFLNCKEELLAYVAVLDFLTCCCQEGNLFPLYEKCKDSRKRYHIAMIDDDLKFLLEKLKSKAINLEQLRSLEKFILASLERIPKSLMNSFSVKPALQKKIQSFKETEKNRHEKSEYHFDDSSPEPPCKKWKPSISSCCKPKGQVVATSKNWREQTISPEFLPQTFCDDDDDFDASCNNESKVVKTSTPKKDTNKYEPSTSSASTSMQAVKTSTPKIVTNEFKQPKMNSYSNISSMQKTSLTSPYKSKKLAWSSKYVSPSKQAISKTLPMGKNVLDPRRDTNNVIRNLCLSNDKPMATTSQAAMKYKSPSKGCTLVLARKEPGRSPLKLKVTNAVLKQMPLQSFILARKETGRSPLKLKVDNPTHKVPVQSLVKVNLKELAENTPGQSFIKVKLAPQANTKKVAENVAVQADVRMGAQKVQVQSLPKSNVKNIAQKVPVQTVLMATVRNGSGKVPVKPVLKANFRST